jgi:hypothetical protein
MQNRLMVGNLAGAVTARSRTELGDLGLATAWPDLRICRCEYFIRTDIYARAGMLTHTLFDLADDRRGAFPSFSQETLIAGYERKVNWRSGCV